MSSCNCSGKPCHCINSINEHVNRIKQISSYVINEAKYSLIKNEFDKDDELPNELWTEEPQPMSPHFTGVMEADENDEEGKGGEFPEAQIDPEAVEGDLTPIEDETVVDKDEKEDAELDAKTNDFEDVEVPPDVDISPDTTKNSDQVQNDIIRLNVSAMQKMHGKMEQLDKTVNSLNAKLAELNADVDEVKEPTNVEKLISRKEDSYPYYFNLNDMWGNNSFQARRKANNDDGIIKLEDGSYVANFDDLPHYTDQEVKKSFDNY